MQATNVTELIWNEKLAELLRLCHTDQHVLENGSDYDRFLAICKALPMMIGHPYPVSLKTLLQEKFSLTLTPSGDTAVSIWQAVAKQLLHIPCSVGISMPTVEEIPHVPLPLTTVSESLTVVNTHALTDTAAKEWGEWRGELQAFLSHLKSPYRKAICINLGEESCRQVPSIFHVDRALKCRDKQDTALLTAQLARFFAEECQAHDCDLLLEIDARENDPSRFLHRIEKSVGLPRTYIVPKNEFSFQKLLSFAGLPHQNPIFLAVKRGDFPTQEAFEAKVASLAVDYPLGILRIIEGNEIKILKL